MPTASPPGHLDRKSASHGLEPLCHLFYSYSEDFLPEDEILEGLLIGLLLRLLFSRGSSLSCFLVSGSSKAQGSMGRPKLPAALGTGPEYCSCMIAAVWYCVVQIICRCLWRANGRRNLQSGFPCQPLSSSIIHGEPRRHGITSLLWLDPLAHESGRGALYYSTIGNVLLMSLSITRVIHEISISYFP